MQGDAGANLAAIRDMGIGARLITGDLSEMASDIIHTNAVVDAIFGTGLASEVSGLHAAVIEKINEHSRLTVSADIPSGVNSDDGQVMGVAVKAAVTVTFGLPKIGLYTYPGAGLAGRIIVADIGIPAEAVDGAGIPGTLVTREYAAPLVPVRRPDANKGSFGHLLVVAGSAGKAGAAAMAAHSATRSGAGLVTAAVPEGLMGIIGVKLTEEMSVALPQTYDGQLSCSALEAVLALCEKKIALVVGPGLGGGEDITKLVSGLIGRVKISISGASNQ